MRRWLAKTWQDNKSLFLFIMLMLVFRSACADWNSVPTGSMKPTIVEGDRILVNKMAYDLRLPFSHISLHKFGDPARGEIIVFESSVAKKRLVKRVIGIPGDWVAMADNQLTINGQASQYSALTATDWIESIGDTSHTIRINPAGSPLASFAPVQVPPGHYLALGDNRNNSSDSRVIGFIPRAQIVGRTRSVVISLDYENFYYPRSERFLRTL